MREEGHTSQFSRIKQRPPATDLSGPNASAESLTPRSSNLAVEDAADLQFDLSSFTTALSSALSLGRRFSGTRSKTGEVPTISGGTVRYCSQNNHVHGVPSGFPVGGREGGDEEG